MIFLKIFESIDSIDFSSFEFWKGLFFDLIFPSYLFERVPLDDYPCSKSMGCFFYPRHTSNSFDEGIYSKTQMQCLLYNCSYHDLYKSGTTLSIFPTKGFEFWAVLAARLKSDREKRKRLNPVLNLVPSVCYADVLTTTPWNPYRTIKGRADYSKNIFWEFSAANNQERL